MSPNYRTLYRRCYQYALIGHAYRRWYRVALAVIWRLAEHGRKPLEEIMGAGLYPMLCDLVAITSPRCSVKRNLRFAWGEFMERGRPGDMIRSTRVALDHYYRVGKIRGPKTSRFAKVLRGDNDVVVVDTWIARGLGVADNQARNRATQVLARRVMANTQHRLDCVSPFFWSLAEVQAVVWAGIIRTHYSKGKIPMYRTEDVGLYRVGPDGQLSETPF